MLFRDLELNSFFEIPGQDGFPTYLKTTQTQAFDTDRNKTEDFAEDIEVCYRSHMIRDENDVRGYHLDFEDVARRRKYFVFHTGVKL